MPPESRAERETERRRATVLFADITGFTTLVEEAGDEEAYEIVSECLRVLDGIAEKHGGRVEKHVGDCVVAVFGAPVAIENAPRAAVNAALEMRKAVREVSRRHGAKRPLDVHSGINTGSVIADPAKGTATSELPVFGDVVNVASRLKDLAPRGEVWVGPETWRCTKEEFEYRGLEPVALKGKQERIAVYELLSAEERIYKPRAGTRDISSELVGREEELAALAQRSADLVARRGGVVSVVADAGLGKSRLLAEAARAAEAAGVTWLEGRSLSIGQNLRFHPFVDMLRGWAGIGPEDGDAALGKLEAALGELLGPEETAERLPFLATLMNVRLRAEERRRVEAIQGEALETLIHRSVDRVLERLAAQRPLAIVFDDLHWADQSSIELLEVLLRPGEVEPALFVLAFRPHHANTSDRVLELVRRTRAADHTALALEPLGADDVSRLVDNLFRGGEIPLATRHAILDKVAGNPFFAEEVVRSLIDDGAVEARDGKLFATARIHKAVIPGTVQEVIMARLDRLEARRRRVLEVAAVIGGSFFVPVLAEVVEKNSLHDLLPELDAAGLVAPVSGAADGQEYRFKHPLIQEVVYDTILRGRREELHRKVAEAIEIWLTDRAPGYYAMLAYHYGRGRDLERAEEYLFRAGDEAARSAASNEALNFFRLAAEFYFQLHGEGGDPAKKAQLEKSIATAFMNRGELGKAVEHFSAALAHLGDPAGRPRGRAALYRGFALDLAAVCLSLYGLGTKRRKPATPEQRERIDIRFRRGLAQTTTAPEFVFDTLATMRLLDRVDPASIPDAGAVYAGAIGIFSYGGVSFARARRVLARARAVVEGGDVQELRLYYLLMSWIHHYLEGDWSPEHDIDEATLHEGLRYGRLWEVQTYLDLHCERCIDRGDFAAASGRLHELSEFAERYRHDVASAAYQAGTTLLHLARREVAPARLAAERYYQEHEEPGFKLFALGALARVRQLAGEPEAAEEMLTRAAELRARAGRLPPLHLSLYAGARLFVEMQQLEAAIEAGDRERIRAYRRRARRSARDALGAVAMVAARRPEVYRLTGRLAWYRGRHKAAFRWWVRSIREAERLGTAPDLGRTAGELARRLAEGRPGVRILDRDAEGWRAQAREIYAAHELVHDLARLDELARR